MKQTFVRKSLELTPEQWRELERLAAAFEAKAPTGSTAGRPSWRTLIKMLADGQLIITERHDDEPTDLV